MAHAEHIAGLRAVTTPQIKGELALLLKGLACLLGMAYFLTSAVVIVNAFVWLPSMPAAWYQVQRILYWPFQPYFTLALHLMNKPSISYAVYAIVTRSPFLLLSIALPIALLRRRVGK